jgi:RNA polymerase sigma factor (sigma-70 family)
MASERTSPVIQFLRRIAGPPPDEDVTDRHLLERFVAARDEAAFAALVQRHGPMVLGVCRRLLHDAHEAEDAFQATFLVLAHKARSIGRPELLGPWLHGVAYRTAARARQAARRRAREREAAAMPDGDPAVEVAWRELCQVLDEELGRLAQKYRAPLVLFYLGGKTTEEVAQLLGCPKGTVLSRLARGRDRLRTRLVRRGVALSVGVMVGVLTEQAAPAAVPAPLALGTVKAAVLTAAGQAAAGAIPPTVAALTKGVLRSMLLSKLKVVAAVVLVVAVASLGTVVGARQAPADKPAAAVKDDAPKDAEKIVGTWAIVSAERGGKKVPEEMFKDGKWVFAADGKVTAKFRGERAGLGEAPELKGTYKLDPAEKPKEITITTEDGKTQPSIYKLDGDTLTVCMGDSDVAKERPTEFATKEGTKAMLFVLKREKK